jgi:riboflavin synthase
MFTGIVEERGEVVRLAEHRIEIACRVVSKDGDIGASIAVNGVCLTVVDRTEDVLGFDLSQETLDRTTMKHLVAGDPVNLERPVTLAARMGGHMVQGHVDGVGRILDREPDGTGGARVQIAIPVDLRRYVVEKGSITIDGVSLTVAMLHGTGITVAVIPHTLAVTTLGVVQHEGAVNVEVDVVARYVERLMTAQADSEMEEQGA